MTRNLDVIQPAVSDAPGERNVQLREQHAALEAELKRSRLLHAAETRVLEMISTGAPLEAVLTAIAEGMESVTPDVFASILLLDADGQHLRRGAGPSLPEEYRAGLDGIPIGPRAGSCGTAMYRDELVVVSSIASDPLWSGFSEFPLKHDLRACASMPVRDPGGQAVACCAMYRRVEGDPDEAELALLERTAYLVGIAVDRHRKEEALRASEERFRYVAQGTLDAVWDWNLQTDAVWWSQGLQTLFGHQLDELEQDSSSWTLRVHPDDQQQVLAGIHAAIDRGLNEWQAKYRFQRSDGCYARVLDRGVIIRDRQGKPVRMVGGMTDETEKLALEEQLRQSQRLDSMGQLTGGVAHDFNNLLTVILGNAELLAAELARDPGLVSLAEVIVNAAQRGADLTQRLLAFACRQALEPYSVDVNELVAGMNGLLRRTLGEHIETDTVHGEELWPALVDPSQLESALLNLCLNARDAMPAGGRLRIATTNSVVTERSSQGIGEAAPGEYVQVAVTDNGVGIAEKDIERVFEPFFTTKEQGKGTGLGLSMVHGFVTQSHGFIRLDSEPGRGTTVQLYLPRFTGDAASHHDTSVIDPALAHGGDEVILLVEDDALVRHYVHQQLIALGYDVVEADNGDDALSRLAERTDIALLLTDVMMPGMNGRELVERAQQLRPELKVLYTSGYTDDAVVHNGTPERGMYLLRKPYRPADLAKHVRAAVAPPLDAG